MTAAMDPATILATCSLRKPKVGMDAARYIAWCIVVAPSASVVDIPEFSTKQAPQIIPKQMSEIEYKYRPNLLSLDWTQDS